MTSPPSWLDQPGVGPFHAQPVAPRAVRQRRKQTIAQRTVVVRLAAVDERNLTGRGQRTTAIVKDFHAARVDVDQHKIFVTFALGTRRGVEEMITRVQRVSSDFGGIVE